MGGQAGTGASVCLGIVYQGRGLQPWASSIPPWILAGVQQRQLEAGPSGLSFHPSCILWGLVSGNNCKLLLPDAHMGAG